MERPQIRVVTAEEMRRIEAEAVAAGSSYEELMERAGTEIARVVLSVYGPPRKNALVLAGPGNNGGDALVVALHLADNGWGVRVRTVLRTIAKDNRLMAALISRGQHPSPLENALDLAADLEWSNLVVDGLFG